MTYIPSCSYISERIRSEMFASLDPYLTEIGSPLYVAGVNFAFFTASIEALSHPKKGLI